MVETKPKDEKPDYKYITIVVASTLVLSLILAFTLGHYSWDKMTESIATTKTQQTKLDDLNTRLANLKQLSPQADELKAKRDKVLAALPNDKDISNLFIQFEQAAGSSNVNVKDVTESVANTPTPANAVVNNSLVQQVSYSATASATNYSSLKGALSKFENTLRILSITGMELTGKSEGNGLDVKFDITTYLRGQK